MSGSGIASEESRAEYLRAQVAACEGYVRHVALRACRKFPHLRFEDAVEEGRYGLEIAAAKYDVGRGAKFITYAAHWVHVCVIKYARREAARGFTFPHLGKFFIANPHGLEVLGGRYRGWVRPDRGADAADSAAAFWAAVQKVLPAREFFVLDRVYRHGDTLKAAGDALGVSRERARQLEAAALDKVRNRVDPTTVLRLCREAAENGG